jgi:PhnB protein
MKLSICITIHFNGQCEAALRFYERSLGARIVFTMTWGDSPMASKAPAGWEKKILHSRMTLGDTEIVAGDVPSHQYEKPRGFSIQLNLDDPVAGERIFNALAEGGTVLVPFEKTFWAARYGFVVDQFGVPWEVNCEQPE